MNNLKYTLALLGLLILTSCEKLIMEPAPSTDNKAIFDEYATLIKEKYAMLDFKGVEIDQLTSDVAPTVTDELTEKQLFDKLSVLTSSLRDGHSALIANEDDTALVEAFDPHVGFAPGLHIPTLRDSYLLPSVSPEIKTIPDASVIGAESTDPIFAVYGRLAQAPNLAYMYIPSFGVEITDEDLETMFGSARGTDGMILDVRGNGGGNPSLSTKMASYFMESQTYTGFERFKTGPGSDDFVDSPSNVTPAESSHRYDKPVVVLTDRGVYSATTTLCYNMNPLPQVTFMGQRTGGGSGSVADGYLANGWYWSLSTSEFIDHLGNHLDDGIEPDIAVALDTMDTSMDEVIEAAIIELQ